MRAARRLSRDHRGNGTIRTLRRPLLHRQAACRPATVKHVPGYNGVPGDAGFHNGHPGSSQPRRVFVAGNLTWLDRHNATETLHEMAARLRPRLARTCPAGVDATHGRIDTC